ncbi:3251_t:CDS:2 [Diversispora eburnea]|uniref:3251_t:CDS:1 n=1 Tax=Diversispora eburnea TaxID=1213867 RepID=A0A9N8V0X5_9GLOM|nr:3251_t:CDS:2 [Diversispora eburnea]
MFTSFVSTLSQTRLIVPNVPNAYFGTLLMIHDTSSDESSSKHKYILTECHDKVRLIILNRPKELNALSTDLFHELNDVLEKFDNDPNVGAIVITGSERAFSGSGADIKEMFDKSFAQVYKTNFLGNWGKINEIRKPTIAALGGGCELAMSCDIIYAGENAKFGQPEIKLGVIPGAGGTQRLTRAIGKSKAMEIILSGRNFTAQEAEKWGLVSKVLPVDKVIGEAIKLGQEIASFSQPSIQAAKESINQEDYSTRDQKEGMEAFLKKRAAIWTNE